MWRELLQSIGGDRRCVVVGVHGLHDGGPLGRPEMLGAVGVGGL